MVTVALKLLRTTDINENEKENWLENDNQIRFLDFYLYISGVIPSDFVVDIDHV